MSDFVRLLQSVQNVVVFPYDLISFAWRGTMSAIKRGQKSWIYIYILTELRAERQSSGWLWLWICSFEVLGPEGWEGHAPLSWTICGERWLGRVLNLRRGLQNFILFYFFCLCPLKEWEQFFFSSQLVLWKWWFDTYVLTDLLAMKHCTLKKVASTYIQIHVVQGFRSFSSTYGIILPALFISAQRERQIMNWKNL